MAKGTANGAKGIVDFDDANRALAATVVLDAIQDVEEKAAELHLAVRSLCSERVRRLIDHLGYDPDVLISEALRQRDLEIIRNGNGHAD